MDTVIDWEDVEVATVQSDNQETVLLIHLHFNQICQQDEGAS